MRILVSGSRDWPYPEIVWRALAVFAVSNRSVTVVEGGARGADQHAFDWAQGMGNAASERHPADWARHGKAAGFIRNQEMVDLGADVCLVFRYNGSRGATDLLNRARKAGIRCRLIDVILTETNGGSR